MQVIDFDIYLDIHMAYGSTGMREFRLQIGWAGDLVSSFNKLAPIVEPLLGEYFEAIRFDPGRYENAQTAYPSVIECIKGHPGHNALIVPAVLDFYNGRGDGEMIRAIKKQAKRKGVGFSKV